MADEPTVIPVQVQGHSVRDEIMRIDKQMGMLSQEIISVQKLVKAMVAMLMDQGVIKPPPGNPPIDIVSK